MYLSLSTWAIAPLAVVLRDHAKADQVRLSMLRDGPRYERVHVEAIYNDGHVEETTVHEVPRDRRRWPVDPNECQEC